MKPNKIEVGSIIRVKTTNKIKKKWKKAGSWTKTLYPIITHTEIDNEFDVILKLSEMFKKNFKMEVTSICEIQPKPKDENYQTYKLLAPDNMWAVLKINKYFFTNLPLADLILTGPPKEE